MSSVLFDDDLDDCSPFLVVSQLQEPAVFLARSFIPSDAALSYKVGALSLGLGARGGI
jgi:hypothetical protein